MSETIDIAICGGFSPGSRVLRAAIRELAKEEAPIRVITVVPAMAGLAKAVEEMRSLGASKLIVVDGCEGGCALQAMRNFGVTPLFTVMIEKHFRVTRKGIDQAKEIIRPYIKEARSL